MATFDLTFDRTFRPLTASPGNPPVQGGCRRDGIELTWLTLQGGWMYWVFDGAVIRGLSPKARGAASQGGLDQATKKVSAGTMLLHTSGLSDAEADALATIHESVSVYMLTHNDDDTVEATKVTVPISDVDVRDSRNYTSNFSINIILPSRSSQQL